jgi:hypothetical protein
LEKVLPGVALVVDSVLLGFEADMDVLADIDEVVPLVPTPAVAAEVADCICIVFSMDSI